MLRQFTDMTRRDVEISFPPRRIVSLVPSQTELLYDLGLNEAVVGITKFCVHPNEWFRTKKRVGGTKTVHIDIVTSLQPDLIIANKEENVKEQIEKLAALYPTWVSNIQTIDEGLHMINAVGTLVNRQELATAITTDIRSGFSALKAAAKPKRVAYFIWRNPWMCAGGDTFISDVIGKMGWINVLQHVPRYPEIAPEQLKDLQADLVLLSSEPYPFKQAHIEEIKNIIPAAKVMLVDGEMFSWYGSRMLKAVKYLESLLEHPTN